MERQIFILKIIDIIMMLRHSGTKTLMEFMK